MTSTVDSNPKANHGSVEAVRHILAKRVGLDRLPKFLNFVMDQDSWKERETTSGTTYVCNSFHEFITASPLRGLGIALEELKHLLDTVIATEESRTCYRAVEKKIRETSKECAIEGCDKPHHARGFCKPHYRKAGGFLDNVKKTAPTHTGNSRQRTLDELEKKGRGDLASRVLAGELSANAAAIEAGFRTPTVTVKLDPAKAVATLHRKFTAEQWTEFQKAVAEL